MQNRFIQRLIVSFILAVVVANGGFFPFVSPAFGGDSSDDDSLLIAPNLMVIFGNSWSMNREMDDQTYPSVPADERYQFADDKGTLYAQNLYAGKPTSKFYQSKRAFREILKDDRLSGKVNIGLATFRQVFGLPSNSEDYVLNYSYVEALPSGGKTASNAGYSRKDPAHPDRPHPRHPEGNSIYEASTPVKEAFARDPENFSWIRWGRQRFYWHRSGGKHPPACAYTNYGGVPRYGNPANGGNSNDQYFEAGRGFLDDDFTTFLDNNDGDGGLPLRFRYKPAAVDQKYIGTECNSGNDHWPWAVHTKTGARSDNEANEGKDVIEHSLCRVGYNSQNNTFWALYTASRPFVNNYSGHSVSRPVPGSPLWDGHGHLKYRDGTDVTLVEGRFSCSIGEKQRPRYIGRQFFSDEYRPTGPLASESGNTPAYHSYIPHYFAGRWWKTAGARQGALSGWSGETVYDPDDNGVETMTAVYPSGVADPCRADRNLCPDTADANDPDALFRYVKTMGADLPDNPRHMGVFLDLPDPEKGYVDQRKVLLGFMNYRQMSSSGLDYDPETENIAGGKGLATTATSSDHQSPIYQSLFSALAYFSAYKAADPYDACGRSNHLLLFYDGKEDGRWTKVDGRTVYAAPEEMAARLYNELDVKVHVVILSNNYGDIDQANAIAERGGTGKALVVTNLASLKSALSSVFAVVRSSASHAPPAISPVTTTGDLVFEVTDGAQPDFGQVTAYRLRADGSVDASSPVWRADDGVNQTVAIRKDRLLSTDPNGQIVNFYSDLPDSVFGAGNDPDAGTIREYTMDPNYGDGTYLAGRSATALIGRIGAASPVIVDHPRDSALFSDPDYRQFMSDHADRRPAVLFTSQDGFLYALDAESGALLWGWMPAQMLGALKHFNLFQKQKYFPGDFSVVDARDADGDYHTYLTGSGKKGRFRFTLRLDSDHDGNLQLSSDSLIWSDTDTQSGSNDNSATVIWRSDDGAAFAVYKWRVGSSGEAIMVRDVGSGAETHLVVSRTDPDSGKTVYPRITSAPMVVKEKDGNTYIYVGDSHGELYRFWWDGYASGSAGSLTPDDNFAAGVELGADEPITHIGYATYKGREYLRVQSGRRLTILERVSNADDWSKRWSVYPGGADKYSQTPSLTTEIQHLPDNAQISGEALIVLGSVMLPVYEASSGSASCSVGGGYFYIYSLDAGLFPSNKFKFRDQVLVDSDGDSKQQSGANNPKILLGKGKVHQPIFGVLDGRLGVFGHTEDSSLGRVEVNQSPIGVRNWREIYQ